VALISEKPGLEATKGGALVFMRAVGGINWVSIEVATPQKVPSNVAVCRKYRLGAE